MREYIITESGREFRMRATSDECLIAKRAWAKGNFYEDLLLRQLTGLAGDGVVIDGGAHLGNHSVYLDSFSQASCIFAIEAASNTFKGLEANLYRNHCQRVVAIEAALDEELGKTLTYSSPSRLNTGSTQMSTDGNLEHAVSTVTIDAIARESRVTLIKLDVEGMEAAAIRGAKKTIERCHPVIVAESKTPGDLHGVRKAIGSGYDIRIKTRKPRTFIWTHRQ